MAVLRAPDPHPGPLFRFLRLTGTYSYGLYVIHAPVLYVLRDLGWRPTDWAGQLAYATAAGVISYALAATSWHFFESRILGNRQSVSTPPAAATADRYQPTADSRRPAA